MTANENTEPNPTEHDSIPFTRDMPADGEEKSIEENVQWEEGFNLRAMTSTFIMLVIWIVFWGWLCFKVFIELSEPRYRHVTTFHSDEVNKGTLKDAKTLKEMMEKDKVTREEEEKKIEKKKEETKDLKKAEELENKVIILPTDVIRHGIWQSQLSEDERKGWSTFYKKINGKTVISEAKYNTIEDKLEKAKWMIVKTQFAFLGENKVNLYIFLVIAGLPFLMILYRAIYKKVSVSYVLTDYRLLIREGLFVKREYQIRLIQIKDLAVYQGLIQLVLGVGTVHVFSNDADTPDTNLDGIREPVKRKETIFKISEQKKKSKEFYMGQA
ncbi:MAG: PH domain-containing protein [Planctomycetes bacterium]|nr:PH domain-containing protein [Planctomycetota bacterium]